MNYNHLRITDLVKLSTRAFFVNPSRTLLTILGTSVGISAVVFLVSLGYGFQYLLLGRLVVTEDSLTTLTASYPTESGLTISIQDADGMKQLPDVTEISRMAEFPGEVDYNKMNGLVMVREIDGNFYRLSGVKPDIGDLPTEDDGGVVLTNQAARLLNMPVDKTSLNKEVGLKVTYQTEDQGTGKEITNTKPLPIKGLVSDDSEPAAVYVYNKFITQQPPSFASVLVKGKDLNAVEPLRNKLTDKGFLISAKLDLITQAKKIMNAITIVLAVFGVTALTVSAIGMLNTMIVGFLERIYEVGVMKSLGATDSDVRNLFLMESIIMGLSGGVAGVAIGVGAGRLLNMILNIVATKMGGKALQLFITPWWFVGIVVGTSAFIGFISGVWPAHRASKLSPKEAFLRK